MRKGFTVMECIVAVAILAILAGMLIPAVSLVRDSARRANGTTDNSKDECKTSKNKTPSGPFSTYIITDPKTGQQWLFVRGSSGVSILPYKPETKVE